MADDKKNQGQQLSIDLPEDIAEGVYSNLAIITHSFLLGVCGGLRAHRP